MDELELFDKNSIKDISKKTRISEKDLEYIRDEDFDNISKTKGLGFIKIIEREYGVDLSEKREKLISYLKEHDRYKNKEFFIAPPSKRRYSKYIAFFILVLMLAGVIFIFYLKKPSSFSTVEKSYGEQNPIVNEAKEISGIEINSTNTTKEDGGSVAIEENMAEVADDNQTSMTTEENSSKVEAENKQQNIENNVSEAPKSVESSAEQVVTQVATTEKNTSKPAEKVAMENSLILSPKSKLWVGVIDMNNHKKKSYIKDNNLTIAVNSDMLIATGHGEFTLYYKDKKLSFSTKSPIRFYIKDGNLTEINKKEFIKLNKGRYW